MITSKTKEGKEIFSIWSFYWWLSHIIRHHWNLNRFLGSAIRCYSILSKFTLSLHLDSKTIRPKYNIKKNPSN